MRILLFTLLSLCAFNAFGFGATGHRVVGAIAEQHLSEEAKQQIKAILAEEDLAEASTYADEMRSNPSEFWQKTASPFHYVTVPVGKSYKEVGAPKKGDAVTALEQFSNTLQNKNAKLEDKQVALRFIVHIVGDLHQPLHAGNGTDRGGNDHKVEFFGEDSNLHRVWDSGLINREELSYSEMTAWLARTITPQDVKAWHQVDPQVWIKESIELRDTIYPEDKKLSYDYRYKFRKPVMHRLKQAGVRLAHYLNHIFKADN